jgi:O-antigen ligase
LKLAALLAVLGVLAAYMMADPEMATRLSNPDTGNWRVGMAYASLKLFAQNPILGSGFGSFNELIGKHLPDYMLGIRIGEGYTSHVTLLTLLAELGILGTLLVIAFVVAALATSIAKSRRGSLGAEAQLLVTVNHAFVLAFLVNAFLIDMRFFSLAYCWLFMSVGMIQGVFRSAQAVPDARPEH